MADTDQDTHTFPPLETSGNWAEAPHEPIGPKPAEEPPAAESAAPVPGDDIALWIDGKRYTVPSDPQKIPVRHLNAIELSVGLTAGAFAEKLMDPNVSTLAWTALAWVAKRMAGEFVKWDDFQDDLSTAAVTEMFEKLADDLHGFEPAAGSKPNRAEKRAAARSGDPRKRSA